MRKFLTVLLACLMLLQTTVIYAANEEFEFQETVFGFEFDSLTMRDLYSHFNEFKVEDGNLVLKYARKNPYFYTNTTFSVNCDDVSFMEVRMLSESLPISYFKVYFLTPTDGTWNETKTFYFQNVPAGNEMNTYRVYFEDLSKLDGKTISSMRIDLYDDSDAENVVLIDYIRFCKAAKSVSENSSMIRYDFNKNNPADGWDISDNAQNVYITDGAIGGESTETVYVETCADLSYNAAEITGVGIKLKNGTADTSAKLYYTTTSSAEYTEENCFEFPINPNDSDYTAYFINTENAPSWRENITGMKFELANSGGSFAVDEITLYKFPGTISVSGTEVTVDCSIADNEWMPVYVTVEDTRNGSLLLDNAEYLTMTGGAVSFSFTGEDTGEVIPYKILITTLDGFVFSKTYAFIGESFDEQFLSNLNTAKENEDADGLYDLIKNNYVYAEKNTSNYLDTFLYEEKYKDAFTAAMLSSDDFTDLELLGARIDECIVLAWMLNADSAHAADTESVLAGFESRQEYKYYNTLDDSIKAECIAAAMAKNPYTYTDFYDALAEQSILITVSTTTGWEIIKEIVETYAETIGIDRDKVDTLKNKELVYLNMVGCGDGENLTSYSQLAEAFDDADDSVNSSSGGSSGGGSSSGGGGSSRPSGSSNKGVFSSNKATSVSVGKDITYTIPEEEIKKEQGEAFSDMEGHEWAIEGVENLRLAGIIEGRGNGMFVPSGLVTREEFVKMLVLATKRKGTTELSFADVKPGAWYEEYIKVAVLNGYITGVSADRFGIGENITRQDVCVIASRVLAAELGDIGDTWETTFADADRIAPYATEAVNKLNNVGLVTGANGMFRPLDCLTRAEAAVIIDRMMKYSDTI